MYCRLVPKMGPRSDDPPWHIMFLFAPSVTKLVWPIEHGTLHLSSAELLLYPTQRVYLYVFLRCHVMRSSLYGLVMMLMVKERLNCKLCVVFNWRTAMAVPVMLGTAVAVPQPHYGYFVTSQNIIYAKIYAKI